MRFKDLTLGAPVYRVTADKIDILTVASLGRSKYKPGNDWQTVGFAETLVTIMAESHSDTLEEPVMQISYCTNLAAAEKEQAKYRQRAADLLRLRVVDLKRAVRENIKAYGQMLREWGVKSRNDSEIKKMWEDSKKCAKE